MSTREEDPARKQEISRPMFGLGQKVSKAAAMVGPAEVVSPEIKDATSGLPVEPYAGNIELEP